MELLAQPLQTRMNLEMAATEEMVGIARRIRPPHSCLVPEKREELTTEGGLDVAGNEAWIKRCTGELSDAGIQVSLFIDADPAQIEAAVRCRAPGSTPAITPTPPMPTPPAVSWRASATRWPWPATPA